jgi:hypothetical protein
MIPPAAAGNHLPRHALQAEEHTLRIDPVDAVPVFLRQVHDVGTPCDSGIVHQDVDLSIQFQGAPHHAIDVAQIAHVRRDGGCPVLQRHDGLRGFLGFLRVDVGYDDVRPRGGQGHCRRFADPLARAGHQCDLIGQSHLTLLHKIVQALTASANATPNCAAALPPIILAISSSRTFACSSNAIASCAVVVS